MWCPLLRFVVDQNANTDEVFKTSLALWYGLWLRKDQPLSETDKTAMEEVLFHWYSVMVKRGQGIVLSPNEWNEWEEVHLSFSFGQFQVKSMILFTKKSSP